MKSKKQAGVMMSPQSLSMPSTMNLEGKHAKAISKQPLGKKLSLHVSAKKVRHSINHDGTHSASLDITGINDGNDKEPDGDADDKKV